MKTRKQSQTTIQPDVFITLCRNDFGVEVVKEYRFHPTRKWRFDDAIPSRRIAIEVEGGVWTQGRHTRPKGFLGDMEKYNTATLMGWRVFRTTPNKLRSISMRKLLKNALNNNV